MTAAIYTRKSTDQNLPDAEKSVTRQAEHGTAYAARKGWTVDPAHAYTDDAVSGADGAVMRALLLALEAGRRDFTLKRLLRYVVALGGRPEVRSGEEAAIAPRGWRPGRRG